MILQIILYKQEKHVESLVVCWDIHSWSHFTETVRQTEYSLFLRNNWSLTDWWLTTINELFLNHLKLNITVYKGKGVETLQRCLLMFLLKQIMINITSLCCTIFKLSLKCQYFWMFSSAPLQHIALHCNYKAVLYFMKPMQFGDRVGVLKCVQIVLLDALPSHTPYF